MASNQFLEAALRLACAGRLVFPVDRHKKPVIKDWPNKATTDERIINAWFERERYNLALVTGDKSGFFCLDVDGDSGKRSLTALEKRHSPISLEKAFIALTPSLNSLQYYFKMPHGKDIRNSTSKIGKGLDIRANGGYVVVPPSRAINKQGIVGRYQWVNTVLTLVSSDLPVAPAWLIDLAMARNEHQHKANKYFYPCTISSTTLYGQKALDEECCNILNAVKGTRNDTLNRSAFNVYRLVSGGEIDLSDAEMNLREAATACGLKNQEITLTLASAKNKAMHNPRQAPKRLDQPLITIQPNTQVLPQILPEPPLDAFPPKIQQLLKEASRAFKRLPVEVPIVALLSLLAACISRSRVVVVKEGWEEGGNLYLGVVATSGTGKSPCFKEFLRPLWLHEIKNKAHWDKAMAVYNLQMEERRKTKDPALLGPLPEKPKRTQHIVEDITLEALGEVLAENPRGVLWYSDELSSIMLNFDRYSNSKGGTESRLLSAYDGAPWKITRRDREKDQVIPSAVLSITGTVEPRILKNLFGRQDAASGFLPRFIFIKAMQKEPPYLDDVVFTGQEILEKITDRLISWQMQEAGERFTPCRIHLSKPAYEAYLKWHNHHLIDKAWGEAETSRSIAAKLGTQVIRIALLLHSLDAALIEADGLAPIQLETIERAIKIGDWIMAHQKLVWLALDIEESSLQTPLDKAIVTVSLSLENDLAANNWRVSNDGFNRLVAEQMKAKIDNSVIGRSASKLGIKNVYAQRERCKEFSPELLKQFKLEYYLQK